MDEIDIIFARMGACPGFRLPLIACLFTGQAPSCAAPMSRDPEPATGMELNEGFASIVQRAASLNSAAHDGAIMLGREDANESYRVVGWSFRLFPPGPSASVPNRGSAFNSCLAISEVIGVERSYLISRRGVYRFQSGAYSQLELRDGASGGDYARNLKLDD